MSSAWESAWKDLIKIPEYVVNLWPFALGFGAMNIVEAYVMNLMPDDIGGNEELGIAAKLLVSGSNETGKFVYWDNYDMV
jgi:hypothetical protein